MITEQVQRVALIGMGVLLATAVGYGALQHVEVLNTRLELTNEQNERALETNARLSAALAYAAKLSKIQSDHAATQLKATDDFTKTLLAQRADAAGRLVAAQRLHDSAEGRAASYRRLAEAGTAECRYLADRSATLDGQLAAGQVVVANLIRDLERRDSEVMVLKAIVTNDRAAVLSAQPTP